MQRKLIGLAVLLGSVWAFLQIRPRVLGNPAVARRAASAPGGGSQNAATAARSACSHPFTTKRAHSFPPGGTAIAVGIPGPRCSSVTVSPSCALPDTTSRRRPRPPGARTSWLAGNGRSRCGVRASRRACLRSVSGKSRHRVRIRQRSSRSSREGVSGHSGVVRLMPHVLTDHETIRRWAEARGVRPAVVSPDRPDRQDDVDLGDPPAAGRKRRRLGTTSARPVTWAEWFQHFDANDLALLIEDAARQPSHLQQNRPPLDARIATSGRAWPARDSRLEAATRTVAFLPLPWHVSGRPCRQARASLWNAS